MTSKTTRNRRKFLVPTLAVLVAAAIAPVTAQAQLRQESQQSDIPYLSWGVGITRAAPAQVHGGVTPTNLARAYVVHNDGVTPTNLARAYAPYLGVSQPDGFQPQTRNVETASASASGSSIDSTDVARGFGLGLALAIAAGLGLVLVRRSARTVAS